MWYALENKEMDGCVSWMKREGLYTSGVVGSETTHIENVK